MEIVFDLFVTGFFIAALCAVLFIGGLFVEIAEHIPALGKVLEWVEGLMMR